MKSSSVSGAATRRGQPAATLRTWFAAKPWLLAVATLIVATLACYCPVLRAGFIWDDDKMLTANAFVRLPLGLFYIWGSTALPDYYPLTSTSFWLEWRLWGLNAAGYHLVNVLLHAGSACLLWQVLKCLRVPGAWLAALVFAVHPINVQSVAWIAERKNTLCMFCFLLSLLWYLRFNNQASEVRPRTLGVSDSQLSTLNPQRRYYWLSLLAFLCALLSKTAVVMLPFVLMLCHWWQHRQEPGFTPAHQPRSGSPLSFSVLLRLSPFFALSLVLGLVTMWFQSHRSIGSDVIRTDDFLTRLAAAGRAVWFYAGKTVAPLDLCFVYPMWKTDPHDMISWLPLAGVVATLAAGWTFRKTWSGPLWFAFSYFLLLLLPTLGLVNVYFQRYSLVGDHWTYFASPAIVVLVVGSGDWLFSRYKDVSAAWLLPAAGLAGLVWLVPATWRQAQVYHDLGTLWEDTLAKNPDCWMAHNSLGSALADVGRTEEARAHFEQGLAVKPDAAELLNNYASVLLDQGKPGEAVGLLRRAIEVNPRSGMAHYNLGNAYDQQGKPAEAEREYRRALELDPTHAEAHSNLGCLLYAAGRKSEAVDEFTSAITLKPGYAEALNNLATIFLEQGRYQQAESLLLEAVRQKPADPDAWFSLGNALLAQGRLKEAMVAYQRVLASKPTHALAHCRLGTVLWHRGDSSAALDELAVALKLQPELAEAHHQAGLILAAERQPAKALTHLRRAVELQPDWPEALAGVAFTLATAAQSEDRNAAEALRLAARAVELSGRTNFIALDALAAAQAETAAFADAVRTAGMAAALARSAGDTNLAAQIQQRAKQYESGHPHRQ